MSTRAAAYQAQVGGRAGQVYSVNGVKFDAFRADTLIDAKGPGYGQFVRNGQFAKWFKGADSLVNQAQRQVAAAGGRSIEWHVAERSAADAMRKFLQKNGISGHQRSIHFGKMTALNSFYLSAFWGPRRESAANCAERAILFLEELRAIDDLFATWYLKARSRKNATTHPVILDLQYLTQQLAAGVNRSDSSKTPIEDLGLTLGPGQNGPVAARRPSCDMRLL